LFEPGKQAEQFYLFEPGKQAEQCYLFEPGKQAEQCYLFEPGKQGEQYYLQCKFAAIRAYSTNDNFKYTLHNLCAALGE
jgi:hypothetical protein